MMQRFDSRDLLNGLLLLIVCVAIALTTLGNWAVLTPDSFGYLGVARCLAHTGGFPEMRLTLPPGLSILIAPLLWIGPAPFAWIRLVLIAGWASGAMLTFAYYRSELGRAAALGAGLIVASSPACLTQSSHVLSELAFLPLVMGALLAVRAWRQPGRTSVRGVFIASALVAVAMMVRTMGIALVPVAVIVLLVHKGNRWSRRFGLIALFLLLPVALQAAWSFRNSGYEAGYGYAQILTQPRAGDPVDAGPWTLQLDRLQRYGPQRLTTIKQAVVPNILGWRLFQPPWDRPTSWLIGGGLLLLCLWRTIFHHSHADAFAVVLFAILAIWPWDEGPRFVLPLLPVFAGSVVCLLAGRRGESIVTTSTTLIGNVETRKFSSRVRAGIAGGFVFAALLVQGMEVREIASASAQRRDKESQRVVRMQLLALMLDESLTDGARLACVMPNESYAKTIAIGAAYFSSRAIARFHDVHDGESVDWAEFAQFDTLSVDSLSDGVGQNRELLPATDQNGHQLVLIAPSEPPANLKK